MTPGATVHDAAWPQARLLAHGSLAPRQARSVPLAEAAGTTLAEDLVALTALPPFATATMDGWAVSGPPPWHVVGQVLAGAPSMALSSGQAVEIATGSQVPDGADAVLRREHGRSASACVEPLDAEGWAGEPLLGRDIRPRGEEAERGSVLLNAGTVITPPVLGLAAASGHDRLLVHPSPTVDVLVLGDELLDRGLPDAGLVRDALGPQIPGWVRSAGGTLSSLTSVPDRLDATVSALRACTADLVITTGGTARGPVDQVHPALDAAGATLVVDRVAVRPGHPMLLAHLGDQRFLVGLPGNPLAAAVGFASLVGPALLGARGLPLPRPGHARLLDALLAPPDAHRLVPVLVSEDGPVRTLTVLAHHGPAMLRGLAQADALAVAPPGGAQAGTVVEMLGLPWA
ncbi:MAG: molybdopterin molybdotransferase MoeA [Actinomycetes bacterium]